MKTHYDNVKTLVRTEKGTMIEPQRKYLFEVSDTANKIQIRSAIEEIYKVKVEAVNTMTVPAKVKQVRREQGRTTPWKKAVVTLKEGHKIDIT
jgi:large subunit ribosomal protein L23